MKYKNKATGEEIEAFQYDGDLSNDIGYYVPDWAVKAFEKGDLYYDSLDNRQPPCDLFIKRENGRFKRIWVKVGDYVVFAGGDLNIYDKIPFEHDYKEKEVK